MRIAILGSGVIGTTAAYYLARDGHEVTVIERRNGPAQASFATPAKSPLDIRRPGPVRACRSRRSNGC